MTVTALPTTTEGSSPRFSARRQLDRIGNAVLTGVDHTVTVRWDSARRRAASATGETVDDRVQEVVSAFLKELTAVGAASGAAAAAPGVGTVAGVATMAAEMGWFTIRVADLILTIAALHGHEQASVEERRAWVLSVLAFGDAANKGFTKVAGEVGKGLSKKAVNAIPTASLRAINKALGRTVITKYGTKRGAIALGRLLPFGVGAALGGGLNYLTVRTLARQTDKFFRLLPGSQLTLITAA